MNSYEQRQEAKKERYAARAARIAEKADGLRESAHAELGQIPFGQPILVGHHSERGMRNLIERNHNKMRKSFELRDKAEHYERKAEAVGTGGISSDDPDAVPKLEKKLADLRATHETMVRMNREARKNGQESPCEAYQLSNSSANIRSTQKRIQELRARSEMVARPDVSGQGWTLKEDVEENRIMFVFDGKPAEDVRSKLRHGGFKWSPTRGAWVRQITNQARYRAEMIAKEL